MPVGLAPADLTPLNADAEPDRMDWPVLDAKSGTAPATSSNVGGAPKTLT